MTFHTDFASLRLLGLGSGAIKDFRASTLPRRQGAHQFQTHL